MSTFPGAFSSSSSGLSSSLSSASSSAPPASALTTSGLSVVSLLPLSLPYISTSSGGVNSFVAHSFGGDGGGNNGLIGGGGGGGECEYNGNAVMDVILDRMKAHLTEEKIVVQNGAITIYASIVRFVELSRLRATCIRKLDSSGSLLAIPFEAEIRTPGGRPPQVQLLRDGHLRRLRRQLLAHPQERHPGGEPCRGVPHRGRLQHHRLTGGR